MTETTIEFTAQILIEANRTHSAVSLLGINRAMQLAKKRAKYYDTRDPLLSRIYHESIRIMEAIDLDLRAAFNGIIARHHKSRD